MPGVSLVAIGWRAHAALERCGGLVRPLGAASGYLDAAGEIVWLGGPGHALHGRAILALDAPLRGGSACVPVGGVTPWRPVAIDPVPAAALAAAAARVHAALPGIGEPRGLGAMLAGRVPDFPLAAAAPAAGALARACAAGRAAGAAPAAAALLGLGPGLTPSGDDFVGGAFFARRLLGMSEGWAAVAGDVRRAAAARTHPVSAALLGDLLDGEGWAPLHDLAAALAAGDGAAGVAAARRLAGLGHSSGWDLLAGLLGALTAGAAFARAVEYAQ